MSKPAPHRIRIHPDERADLLGRVGPVVDAHFHLWDLQANHYPWLQEQPVEAHFGDYGAIRRDYLPQDFRGDSAEVKIAGKVHVEAHWRGFVDPVGETEWLTSLKEGPSAIVGHANLLSDDLEQVLNAHMQSKSFRGVRMMTQRSASPSGLELLEHPGFRRGLGKVAARGLSFDLQARPDMLFSAALLAQQIPDLNIALTHVGLPLDRTAEGLEVWQSGLSEVAKAPNVICKLSGLVMGDWAWTVESIGEMTRRVFDIFGPDRICFGSNFPVDSLFARYPDLLAAHIFALKSQSDADLKAVFHDTAVRLYNL